MKKFKPLQIREFTPLTELEMKNIFGGDQDPESGSSGEKCAKPDTGCMVTFAYKDYSKYGPSNPAPPSPLPRVGQCKTTSGSWTGSSGATVPGVSGCDCVTGSTEAFDSGAFTASHNCQQKN